MEKCKYEGGTSRVGLYIMVFLMFLNIVCNNISNKIDSSSDRLERIEIKIDSLLQK